MIFKKVHWNQFKLTVSVWLTGDFPERINIASAGLTFENIQYKYVF